MDWLTSQYNGLGGDAEEGLELLFAVVCGDKERFIENCNFQDAVGVQVAGGHSHLGELAFGSGEGNSLLFFKLTGLGREFLGR